MLFYRHKLPYRDVSDASRVYNLLLYIYLDLIIIIIDYYHLLRGSYHVCKGECKALECKVHYEFGLSELNLAQPSILRVN